MPSFTLPTAPERAIVPADRSDPGGADLALDITSNELRISASGDYALIDGDEAGKQSVRREATTSPGEYVRFPDYGFGVRDGVMRGVTRSMLDGLIARARARLARNPRVARIRDVIARVDPTRPDHVMLDIQADVGGKALTITTTTKAKR